MKYCTSCHVNIQDYETKCPLCHVVIEEGMADSIHDKIQSSEFTIKSNNSRKLQFEQNNIYPDFEVQKRRDKKLVKTISKTAILLIITSLIINRMIYSETLWSVIFSSFILYFWLVGLITFKKSLHPGLKMTAHAIATPLLLIVINTFAPSSTAFARVSWAISYGMPIIIIGFILAISIIILRHRQNLRNYLLYLLSLCVIGFVPLILVLSGVAHPIHLSLVAAVCSYMTLAVLFIFARRIVVSELGRKFHF